LGQLPESLSQQNFLSAYNKLLNELNVPGRNLSAFFEHIFKVYGQRRPRLALVLLMDQFEELFTRFIDPGVIAPEYLKGLPDWPINLQLNRPAALLVEVLLTFLCVLFGLLILFILMGLTIPDFFYRSGSAWLILIPFYCVLAATVRVGTIMVFGQFKGKRINRSAQVMAGTLAGFLVMSIVYFIFWLNDAFKHDLEGSVAQFFCDSHGPWQTPLPK
jgi:hypothetical protein